MNLAKRILMAVVAGAVISLAAGAASEVSKSYNHVATMQTNGRSGIVGYNILPEVTATLRWKYEKNTNGWFCAQVAIPWHEGYNEAISNLRLLIRDRYYTYGESLDEEQMTFFKIPHMVELVDDDGNRYYMNAKTGNIYSEEFLRSGYKEVLRDAAAMKDPYYLNGRQVGTTTSIVSDTLGKYFDENGAINDDGINFRCALNNGVEVKLSTTQGQLAAYLADPVTWDKPPWGMEEPWGTAESTNKTFRAVPIEFSSFSNLPAGERAVFGVSDLTMTNAPASVPMDERKICLRIVDRDIYAAEAIENIYADAWLAWDENGESRFNSLIAEVPKPSIANIAVAQREAGVAIVDFSFDVVNSPELFCADGIQPVFCISVMDNATGSNLVASAEALSGDVGAAAGSHNVTWNMDVQGLYLLPTNLTFWVSYVKNPVGSVFDPAADAAGEHDGEPFVWRPQSGFYCSVFTGEEIKPPPPVVSNVVARQRWPWNGLVDVDYEIDIRTADCMVEIDFDEQGGLNRHWVATNFLAGAEPTLNRGHNRATWDAKAAGATNVVADVVATVKLVNSLSVISAEESSEAFRLDTREGQRQSDGTETLAFSASWSGNSNSVVTIAQACDTPCTTNGALVSGLNGEGEWSWTAQYDGTYTLTHVTIADGVTGKVETATFVVRGLGSPVADLTAEIAWKLLEATGTYFAQLKVTCTNEILVGIDDLKFVFADRVGADGKNEAVLWNTPARSANANTMTAAGKEYRFVALDPALITAENTPVVYGVSNMSASSIPVNERTIEMYVRRRVNPQSGNESAANVDNFVGYVVWSSGGENLSLPVAAGAVGRALGAAGLSVPSATKSLPSPKRLNTALAVGVMPEEDGEPYCRFSEFSVDGDTIRGKIEVGADGQAGRVGQNARLVLLGGDSPGGALADLCTVDVGSEGSFSVPAPKDARFFKLALEIGEMAE